MKKIYNLIAIENEPNLKNSALKTIAAQVSFPLLANEKKLIALMKAQLYAMEGVGLAAPQVNVKKVLRSSIFLKALLYCVKTLAYTRCMLSLMQHTSP